MIRLWGRRQIFLRFLAPMFQTARCYIPDDRAVARTRNLLCALYFSRNICGTENTRTWGSTVRQRSLRDETWWQISKQGWWLKLNWKDGGVVWFTEFDGRLPAADGCICFRLQRGHLCVPVEHQSWRSGNQSDCSRYGESWVGLDRWMWWWAAMYRGFVGQMVIQSALLVWDLMSVCYIFPLTYSSLENGHNEDIHYSLFNIYRF